MQKNIYSIDKEDIITNIKNKTLSQYIKNYINDIDIVFYTNKNKIIENINFSFIFDKNKIAKKILNKKTRNSGFIEIKVNNKPIILSYVKRTIFDNRIKDGLISIYIINVLNSNYKLLNDIKKSTNSIANLILYEDKIIINNIHIQNSYLYNIFKNYKGNNLKIYENIALYKTKIYIEDLLLNFITALPSTNIYKFKKQYKQKIIQIIIMLCISLFYFYYIVASIYKPIHDLMEYTILYNNNLEFKETGFYLVDFIGKKINYKFKKLETIQDRMELAFIGSQQGLWDLDLITNNIYISKKWKQILGYENDDINNHYSEIENRIHIDDLSNVRAKLEKCIRENKQIYESVHRVRTKNGKYIWVLDRANIIFNTMGKAIRCVGVTIDIRKQKEEEKKLQNINKYLEQKSKKYVKEIKNKDDLLIRQSKLASMGEMIGAIAHQWRQPLNVLSLSIMKLEQNFKLKKLDEKNFNEFTKISNYNINFMSDTIDDFRNFFRLDKEKNIFYPNKTIKEIKVMFSIQFEKENIDINIYEKDIFEIYGYENEFKQVILNILNNAKDSINKRKKLDIKKGKIDINIYRERNIGIISIKDNGEGIDKDIINRVFEPYFTTKFQSKGVGMGLYIAKQILENNMEGEISIDNIQGGTLVTIKHPIL